MLAVDDSASSLRAARHVATLGKQLDAMTVRLVTMQPALPKRVGLGGRIIPAPRRAQQKEAGMRVLARSAAVLDKAGVHYHPQVFEGDPARTIIQQARRAHCDLIVMGTRGRGAVSRVLLGSVASKIVNLAPVPVTLVK